MTRKVQKIMNNFSLLAWAVTLTFLMPRCQGGPAYADVTKIFDDKLGPGSGYKTTVRPLLDQSDVVNVTVRFNIVAIVEIDAVAREFIVNGYLTLDWKDQLVTWTPFLYNNVRYIHPEPKQIWRPRLVLGNTMGARDLFKDDYSPVTVNSSGDTSWSPGTLFPTSCKLDLYKYPFDQQDCSIGMYSMAYSSDEMQFVHADVQVDTQFYTKSGEWEILEKSITIVDVDQLYLTHFSVNFKLKRLPGFFIVNIVIPIVLMSFLNILVFLIPVDSGGKISYGITVLLALTVFMSIVSDELPRSSDTLPLVVIYLLVLTVISAWTVIVAIITVHFHHREEKEVKHQRGVSRLRCLFNKFNVLSRTGNSSFTRTQGKPGDENLRFSNMASTTGNDWTNSDTETKRGTIHNVMNDYGINDKNNCNCNKPSDLPVEGTVEEEEEEEEEEEGEEEGEEREFVNRWKQFGKHLNVISFVVFTLLWISVTVGFLVEISK